MGKYILVRLAKSLFSLFMVMSIVIVMLFTMVDRKEIFQNDAGMKKMKGDTRTLYMMQKYDDLGYLDFIRKEEICSTVYGDDGAKVNACAINDSAEQKDAIAAIEKKNYKVEFLKNGDPYATHDFTWIELLAKYYSKLFYFDNKGYVKEEFMSAEDRGYSWAKNPDNGSPAFVCSGCKYKYQLYFNGSFPFIHQNFFSLDFGNSYPQNSGIPTLEVIGRGQGSLKPKEQTFPTGVTQQSAIIQTSCKYKPTLDKNDVTLFTDNYANCSSSYQDLSMINTSYLMGILALIFAYAFGVPLAMDMARNKGKLRDRIGIAYINILIAVPSLAFIFFMRSIGTLFGLPDKFPQLGFGDIRSYIMPILILGLLSTPSLMMWVRRYMIDQTNADYVKFAKAKGLSKREISNRHILRNAIIPIVNGIPSSVILCISGAFITETAFAVPGMGKMLPDSITKLNNNMVITLTFIFTALSIIAILLGDILMTFVDPRIQLTSKGGND